jgi:hypothetical protein
VEGRYAVAQWTATSAGVYHVYAQFNARSGSKDAPGSSDVHLQGDGRDIMSGGLDPNGDRFCASINLNLTAGATLEFAAGNGAGASASHAVGLSAFVCTR